MKREREFFAGTFHWQRTHSLKGHEDFSIRRPKGEIHRPHWPFWRSFLCEEKDQFAKVRFPNGRAREESEWTYQRSKNIGCFAFFQCLKGIKLIDKKIALFPTVFLFDYVEIWPCLSPYILQ